MHSKTEISLDNRSIFGHAVSWLFAVLVMAIGLINIFWGNDAGYGIFISLLSFAYVPPATALLKKITALSIPLFLKILLGIFILWTALGVAELFDKIDLMLMDF